MESWMIEYIEFYHYCKRSKLVEKSMDELGRLNDNRMDQAASTLGWIPWAICLHGLLRDQFTPFVDCCLMFCFVLVTDFLLLVRSIFFVLISELIMVCIRNGLKVHTQESEVEDCEFAINIRKEELLNRENCTWLSTSDASSCCKDNGFSGYMDLKRNAWFISLLSTQSPRFVTCLNTKITFFDGSRVSPIEEASLVLDQSKQLDEIMVFQENLEEEEVILWLKNESSNGGLECFSQTLDKRSKSKSTDFTNGSDEQSLYSSYSSSDYSSEVMDLEDISADKPLFCPLNSAFDWSSETKRDCFIMSPCKDIYQVHNRESNIVYMDIEKGCNKRVEFKTDSNTSSDMRKNTNIVATGQADVDRLTNRSVHKHKIVLEDLLLVDKLIAVGVIELVLGLGEFDGHEGIESEFNKDEFFFSPWF